MKVLKNAELHDYNPEICQYIVFDIETKKYPVRPKFDVPDEWVAGGWHDYTGMGIACVGFVLVHLYFDDLNKCRITPLGVTDDLREINMLAALIRTNSWGLSGFNTRAFDANLLLAHGVDLSGIRHYDVFDQIAKALNISTDNKAAMRGLGLDAVAKANNCPPKTGKGVEAPKMYQLGQIEKLHAYCLDDCITEASLLVEVHKQGGIINPKTNSYLRLVTP